MIKWNVVMLSCWLFCLLWELFIIWIYLTHTYDLERLVTPVKKKILYFIVSLLYYYTTLYHTVNQPFLLKREKKSVCQAFGGSSCIKYASNRLISQWSVIPSMLAPVLRSCPVQRPLPQTMAAGLVPLQDKRPAIWHQQASPFVNRYHYKAGLAQCTLMH